MHLVKVLFKAISRGERCKFNHYIACDITLEDEVIPEMPVNNGAYKLPAHTLSKWEKADSWVSEQNNVLRNIIDSNDLDCILNWEIIAIDDTHRKPKKEFPKSVQLHESELDKMANILKRTAVGGFSEEFKRNYLYCYFLIQLVYFYLFILFVCFKFIYIIKTCCPTIAFMAKLIIFFEINRFIRNIVYCAYCVVIA